MAARDLVATTPPPIMDRLVWGHQTEWRDPGLKTVASSQPPAIVVTLEQRFSALKEEWTRETAPLSSVTDIVLHPAYQRIIGMGHAALPLILSDLVRQPDHWFWALRAITGEDPVPTEDAGDLRRMRDAWVRLGQE